MKKSKIFVAGFIGLLMKKQNVKWFIALMFITAISFYSHAQDNISLISMGMMGVGLFPRISVDGQQVNRNTDVVTTDIPFSYGLSVNVFLKINSGEHTITVPTLGKPHISEVFIFKPGKYYQAEFESGKIFFIDGTDEVLSGIGGWYDTFSVVEKKFGLTRLANGIGRVRAPTGKSYYNYGVHNYQAGSSEYSTVRIYARDGTLIVKEFNNADVGWTSGGRDSNVVVIPSGKQRLVLDYYAPRPNSDYSNIGNHGLAGLIVGGSFAIADAVKRGKADERDTFDIILDYEFFPGAEYEIKFERSKARNGPYAEVVVTPGKGAPRGQQPLRGVGSTRADVAAAAVAAEAAERAATAAAEAAERAAAAAREAAKLQISYIVAVGGRQTGPYSYDELRQLATRGQLTRNSLVWKEGMQQWAAAGTIAELTDIWSSVPPPLPPPPR